MSPSLEEKVRACTRVGRQSGGAEILVLLHTSAEAIDAAEEDYKAWRYPYDV